MKDLKIELLSTKVDAMVMLPVRNLKSEFFSARLEGIVREPPRFRRNWYFSAMLPEGPMESLPERTSMFFWDELDCAVNVAETDWVYATFPLRSTAIATQGELAERHSVFV